LASLQLLNVESVKMIYLATGLIVAWIAGLLLLLGRTLNFMRLLYNNLAPGKSHWDSREIFRFYLLRFRFLTDATAIDPASLSEIGRQHQRRAVRNDRILVA